METIKNRRRHPLSLPVRRKLAISVAAALAATASIDSFAHAAPDRPPHVLGGIPITFERNDGQLHPDILFLARGVGADVAIRRGELSLELRRPLRREGRRIEALPAPAKALTMTLAGANRAATIEARSRRETVSHHYHGSRRWEAVPHYGEVVMRDVYGGIDLVLHGREGELEYDFLVAPGANAADIRLGLAAAEVSLDARGDLVMRVGGETLRQHAPVAYQHIDGERRRVEAQFELASGAEGPEARFVLGDYDPSRPLVIDPVMSYSTYLGGSAGDFGGFIAADPSGEVYVAHTRGTTLFNSDTAVQVTRLNPATNTVRWTSTLSGAGYDIVQALAIGPWGSDYATYLTGYTTSADFPRCFATVDCDAPGGLADAFVSVLDANGTVVFSRLLGGSGNDAGNGIAADASFNMYVTGDTEGAFPTTASALFASRNGGSGSLAPDAFVAKLNKDTGLEYATYLGGSGTDIGKAIAIDAAGNMYVAGTTSSSDFPLATPLQSSPAGVFLSRIGASGGPLEFSSYLGAGATDDVAAIARHMPSGDLVVVGDTAVGYVFPLVNPLQGFGGFRDAFVTRIGASGGPVIFSTLLGGSGNDYAEGVAIGADGDIYVAGTTSSGDFPVVYPLQGARGPSDVFVSRIGASGGPLLFSTYLGGSGSESAASITLVGSAGSVFVAGQTYSGNSYPTANALRAERSGISDLFLSRIDFPTGPTAASIMSPNPGTTLAGSSQVFSWTSAPGATLYQVFVGSTRGALDIGYFPATGTAGTSTLVSGLPLDGRPIYVRLYTKIAETWYYQDYTYAAALFNVPAAIQSPAAGSTLTGTSQLFTWNGVPGATLYQVFVGSTLGANDIGYFPTLGTTGLSTQVTGLPTDGRTLYVRLYTKIGQEAWYYRDYTYTAALLNVPAAMLSPASGSTLAGASQLFQWNSAPGATLYQVFVGSSVGALDIGYFPELGTTGLTTLVTGLPTDGRTLYVRLYTKIGEAWYYRDYTYTAALLNVPAAMLSPASGSTLAGASQLFQWNGAPGATLYQVFVGSSVGALDIGYFPTLGTTGTSTLVTGLPTDGRMLYVRLYTKIGGLWYYNDYTYSAASAAPGPATLTSPAPGATLGGSAQLFQWNNSGASFYQLWLGSTAGGYDLGYSAATMGTSANMAGLPTDGRTIYARLYSNIAGAYQFTDSVYTAASASPGASVTSPANGSTLSGSTQLFQWNSASGAELYQLWVGNSQGTFDIGYFPAAGTTGTSTTVTGLPTDGRTLHVRLYTAIAGVWHYRDFTYVAGP